MSKSNRADRFAWKPGDIEILTPNADQTPAATLPLALRALRVRRHLSQEQVAEHLGVKQTQVSQFERREDVRLSTLTGYLQAIGAQAVTIDVLFDDGTHIATPVKLQTEPGSHAA